MPSSSTDNTTQVESLETTQGYDRKHKMVKWITEYNIQHTTYAEDILMLNVVYVLSYGVLEEIVSTNAGPVMNSHQEGCKCRKSKRKKTICSKRGCIVVLY